MKRIFPDIQGVLTNRYITQLGFLRKFKRYWGTTVVGGVEVLNLRKPFYPKNDMDESTKKLAKLLGIYGSLQGEMEGIEQAWLYLNISKDPDAEITTTASTHLDNMNLAIRDMTTGSVLISSKVTAKGIYELAPIITDIEDQVGIINEIKANFQSYWDNDFSVFTSTTDSYAAIFLMYLMRTVDISYTITKVEKITTPITYPTSWDANTIRIEAQPAWRVTFQFDPIVLTNTSNVITLLNFDLFNSEKIAVRQVKQHLSNASTVVSTNNGDGFYEPVSVYTSPKWISVPDGVYTNYYLKTEALFDQSTSMTERIKYVTSCIDTGYRKKKAKWWEVVLVLIIIIVVIVSSSGAGSGAATAAGGGLWGAVVAVSVTITLAALFLSLIAYALSAAGLTRMAGAMGEFLKTIEPLVRVASVVTVVNAIVSVWREAVAQAAQQAATQAGVTTVTEVSFTQVLGQLTRTLIEQFTGITSLANMQFANVIKMMDFAFGIYSNEQNQKMKRMIKNERAELSEWIAADEQNKTSDILKDFALTFPDLLSQDESVYASIYDRPYEWWSTPYHIGCIQANTVNALWLSRD